jgi:hypothetical protein
LLALPAFFALASPNRVPVMTGPIVLAAIVLFVGLRYQIGPDWFAYEYIHANHFGKTLADIWSSVEPLSASLFWFSETSGLGAQFSNLVAAFILCFGIWSFAKRTESPWLALLAALPYLVIVFGMSGIRQSMAVGVILYSLSRWREGSLVSLAIGVFVASLFHTSALVVGFFVLYVSNLRRSLKIASALLLAGILLIAIQLSDVYEQGLYTYQSRYLENPESVVSFGAIFHLALVLFPGILALVYRKKLVPYVFSSSLLTAGIWGVAAVTVTFFIQTTISSRLTLYMYFLPMLVYPALVRIAARGSANVVLAGLVILHFLILGTWLSLANHRDAYLPYQNILWSQ